MKNAKPVAVNDFRVLSLRSRSVRYPRSKAANFIVPLWHSHVHAVVCEGVFTESGHFVHIPETWRHFEVPGGEKQRAIEIWQDKVFELLLEEKNNDFAS